MRDQHQPGPVEAAVRGWIAPVDVVADYGQQEAGRVWTRAADVLPGTVVRPGMALLAGWGHQVWTAEPVWDNHDIDLLWLTPLAGPVPRPSIGLRYRPALADWLSPPGRRSSVSNAPTPSLIEAIGDCEHSVEVLLGADADYRALARRVLRAVSALPVRPRGHLLADPALVELRRIARWTPGSLEE